MGGHKSSVNPNAPVISSLQVGTSCYGRVLPLLYGTNRVSANVTWYGDFVQTSHESSQNVGGKGGGATVTNVSYTYSVSLMLSLCEGTVDSGTWAIWVGKQKGTAGSFGMTQFSGTDTQAPWGYLSTKHPADALNYRGVAYLGADTLQLGNSNSVPTISAELAGRLAQTDVGTWTGGDANPANVIYDLLTNASSCIGMPGNSIGSLTNFKNYAIAQGLFVSPAYTTPSPARDMITTLLTISNTAAFYSDGVIKFVPQQDFPVSGNGVTYTPNMTPLYDLTDDQFLVDSASDEPVQCTRKAISDAYNTTQVQFSDRSKEYNNGVAEAKDQYGIDTYGLRTPAVLNFPEIADPVAARTVAQIALQRSNYVRNSYTFRLGWAFCLLEPMDIVTLTDTTLGLDRTPVRITSIEEDEYGTLTITADELPIGSLGPSKYQMQTANGASININVAASAMNTPVIFEPPVWLAGSEQIWIGASGTGNWGGYYVWISEDNATYRMVGEVTTAARQGTLTASLPASATNPDVANTLSVDLTMSHGSLLSGTAQNANDLVTLCYVDGEYLAYETAALTSAYQYNLTYLNRAAYGSAATAHASGAQFLRLDDAIFKYTYDYRDVGKTIYIKLQPFNQFGFGAPDLSILTPISYSIVGSAFGFPSPVKPTVFWSTTADGTVDKLKVSLNFSSQFDSTPDGLLLMYSIDPAPNSLVISAGGTGTTLTIGGADILYTSNPGDFTVKSGSDRAKLVVRPPTNPLDTSLNLGGHWWAQTGATQWRKVTSYDATTLYFQENFDADPVVGQDVNICEASWADERSLEYRFAILQQGNSYEIIRWANVTETGGTFYVSGVLRGQENTPVLDATGATMYYLPAPGVGTVQVDMPRSSFRYESGVWVADANVDITVPPGSWVSMSCVVYRQRADTGVLRSAIVPVAFGGPL